MNYDVIIKNGHLIDPSRKMDCLGDIHVSGGKIVEAGNENTHKQVSEVIDAEGCFVVPGLIDFHTHLFYRGTEIGTPPDLGLIPNGVTTAVDGGSTGCDNYELFHSTIVTKSIAGIKSFINVSPVGQPTGKYDECVDPQYYDPGKLQNLFEKYTGEILGLKLRLSRHIVGELGIRPLVETLKLAEKLGCPIVVHPTDPPVEMEQIVSLLRKGDILTHVYHGTGSTILDDTSKVKAPVREARKRGVIFDDAEGRFNMTFRTAKAAIADGFLPDTISSDVTIFSLYRHPVISLANIISKYLSLGVDLNAIIEACTYRPACLMQMQDSIGTLKPGSNADIAIFKLIDQKSVFYDKEGMKAEGDKLFVPMATIKSGTVMYRRIDLR